MTKEKKSIEVVPYDPKWPMMVEVEEDIIKKVLGEHCLAVHHIGSTSVPGLNAKSDLDIVCVVDALPASLQLQEAGYVFKGELNIPLRYFFSKNTDASKVNLHVVEKDHGFIALNLCFRDYLRTHPGLRLDYADLKEYLLTHPSSYERAENSRFTGYNLGKDRFIKGTLDLAGFDALCINFCMHYREWEEYHRIRKEQIFDPLNVVYDPNHPCMTDDHNYHFVLYKGITIVTVAQIELLNEHEAALRILATDERHKGKGYGSYMLTLLEKWIKYQGRHTIKTHANLKAEHFYRNRGFREMPFDDQSIAVNVIDLGKTLF